MAIRRVRNLSETLTLKDEITADMLGAFAARAIMERNKIVKKFHPGRVTTFVGGREGAAEATVKMGETIRYQFDYMKTIVLDAYKRLRENSPVQVGADSWGKPPDQYRYKDAHIIIADGVVYRDPTAIPDDAAEVTFTNLMPYARKIEKHGWKGTIRFHAPYHTYEITAMELKKYANVVNIKFTFIDMPGMSSLGDRAMSRALSGGRPGQRKIAASMRYPAIKITMR